MGPVFYQKILKHGSTFLTEPKFLDFHMAKNPKIMKFLKKWPYFSRKILKNGYPFLPKSPFKMGRGFEAQAAPGSSTPLSNSNLSTPSGIKGKGSIFVKLSVHKNGSNFQFATKVTPFTVLNMPFHLKMALPLWKNCSGTSTGGVCITNGKACCSRCMWLSMRWSLPFQLIYIWVTPTNWGTSDILG